MSTNQFYINKNFDTYSEEYSETENDSSTSTTEYESKEYDYETQLIENTNKTKNILKELLIQPVMGKPFKPLFSDNEINDSFELSILRFIHLIFSVDGVINFDNLTKYMDMSSSVCNKLYEYFMDNPGVMIDYSFYYSNTGIDIRTKWFELLSSHNFFTYKEESSKQEINSSLDNFFEFFKNFFPNLDQAGNTHQDKLNTMLSQLNFNFESFEVIYSTYQKIITNTVHSSQIINFKINGIDLFVLEMTKLKDISKEIPVEVFSNSEFRYA